MEQSVRAHSTLTPAAQVETRDLEQEARVAALLTGPRDPAPPFSAAAEISLAHMVVDYFGSEDIHPALNCDIALRDRARAILAASAEPDPIFAVIEENRRLFDAWTVATKLPLVGIDPAPETDAAQDAFYAHCDDNLVRTVPQTAAGCAALARYAHDFATREGFTLDNQNKDATDHLRILDLIARSPMLTPPVPGPPVPSQDAELLDIGRRFESAADRERVACAKADAAAAEAKSDPQRIAETDAAANDAGDIAADLAHRIAGIPAHTADGLRLKIRALIHYNAAAFADPPDMPDPDQALAHSLRMDATRHGLEAGISAEAEAQAIVDGIEKLWPEWAALNRCDYRDLSPEAEQRCDAMSERRMALIEAAEDLPATSRTARYAKALALAWYEHVNLWIHRKPLSDYGSDGRLVLDIEASLTGAPAWTGVQA